ILAMKSSLINIPRRRVVAGLLGTASLPLLPGCVAAPDRTAAPDPAALLEQMAWRLLSHEPERATGLGVDTGANARLRGQLKDVSPAGLAAYAGTLRADLARARRLERAALDPVLRTSFEVVES